MARRGQRNLLDLTRESGNVRRALRSNRGLNHELKITFQHIASERNLNDVSWRNKERLVRRRAVHVLGPHQKIISRARAERQQQMFLETYGSRDRIESIILPAISAPPRPPSTNSQTKRSSSVAASSISLESVVPTLANSGKMPSRTSSSTATFLKRSSARSISPSRSALTATPRAPVTTSSFSRLTPRSRPQTTMVRDPNNVAMLEEKLDRFHLRLLEDTNQTAPKDSAEQAVFDEKRPEEDELIDAARLARLRNSLIVSVHGARLRTSARKRRQQGSGVGGQTWQALAAAMQYNPRPVTTTRYRESPKDQDMQAASRAQRRPSTIMEVPSR